MNDKKNRRLDDEAYCVEVFQKFINGDLEKLFPAFPLRFAHPMAHFESLESASARKPSDVLSSDSARVFGAMKSAFRWWPANPSKNAARKRVLDTYVPFVGTWRNQVLEPCNVANSAGPHPIFVLDDLLDSNDNIIVIGARGSGKTAFLNYWLTASNRELEQKRMTWLRFDVAKVFDIWSQHPEASVFSVFQTYFRLHSLFVLSAYGRGFTGEVGRRIDADSASELLRRIVTRATSVPKNKAFGRFHNLLVATAAKILKSTPITRDFSHELIKHLHLYGSKESTAKTAKEAFSEIRDALLALGVRPIIIFDGLDNIAWTKSSSFYSAACRDMGRLCNWCRSELGADAKFILVTRPETTSEISITEAGRLIGFNDNSTVPPFIRAGIAVPAIEEIIRQKLHAATASEGFEEQRQKLFSSIPDGRNKFTKLSTDLNGHSLEYSAMIANIIRKDIDTAVASADPVAGGGKVTRLTAAEICKEGILSVLFDNDIRAFLDNFLKVSAIKYKFLEVGTPGAGDPERVVEYMFLNGRPFYDSRLHYQSGGRRNFQDRGSVFPNLFWYDTNLATESPDLWHGLACLRMLQIGDSLGNFVAGDLIFFLNRVFGYNVDILREMLEAMVAFSLIDVKPVPLKKCQFEAEVERLELEGYRNLCFVTNKGKFMMDYVWMRPDILYFYALDTPLLRALTVNDTRFVRPCREFGTLYALEDFYKAAIATLGTFCLHVLHFEKLEGRRVLMLLNKRDGLEIVNRYMQRSTVLFRCLQIPSWWNGFLMDFVKRGVSDQRSPAAREIRREILGVFGGRSA